jgi:hypothetical protein
VQCAARRRIRIQSSSAVFAGYDGRVTLCHLIVIASAAKQSISLYKGIKEGWIASLRSQ